MYFFSLFKGNIKKIIYWFNGVCGKQSIKFYKQLSHIMLNIDKIGNIFGLFKGNIVSVVAVELGWEVHGDYHHVINKFSILGLKIICQLVIVTISGPIILEFSQFKLRFCT